MQLPSVRLALTFLAISSGSALSQVDSVATPIDTSTQSVLPAPAGDSIPLPLPVPQSVDSPSLPPVAVESPEVEPAPVDPVLDSTTPRPRWSFEASLLYGWRMGQLLREEDRLTREFKIVLIGTDGDSSNVRPIASGTMIQAAAWWKTTPAHQIGLGFGFGRFNEHPVSSYNADLSETFLDQYLVTARYRYGYDLSTRWRLFGEAALGWNHAEIRRIPLVAAHRNDEQIEFQQTQLDQIAALNQLRTVDGVHSQAGLGVQLLLPQSWSISLSGASTWDRIWFERPISAKSEGSSIDLGESLSLSPSYWGFDLGLSVARDF